MSHNRGASLVRGARTVLVVLVIATQQAMLMEKFGLSSAVGYAGRTAKDDPAADERFVAPTAAAASGVSATDRVGLSVYHAAEEGESRHVPKFEPNATVSDAAILFIFCPGGDTSVRYVEQAVLSARTAGWSKRHIVLLDTSYDVHSLRSDFLRNQTGYIYQTIPFDMTFSMLQNVAWQLAKEWGFPFYFWQHADAVITSEGEVQDFVSKALEMVRGAPSNWGVIHFAYDWFTAFKTEVVEDVRWDLGIPHYLADCDFYARVRLAGYEIERRWAGVVLHMKTLLSEGEMRNAQAEMRGYPIEWWKTRGAFETRQVRINREKYTTNPDKDRIALKLSKAKFKLDVEGVKDISSNASQARYEELAKAGDAYFERKWGSLVCDWRNNKLPLFDINDKAMLSKAVPHSRAIRPVILRRHEYHGSLGRNNHTGLKR